MVASAQRGRSITHRKTVLQGRCCLAASGTALRPRASLSLRCGGGAAGTVLQGWHCGDGTAGTVLWGQRCGDGAVGTALRPRAFLSLRCGPLVCSRGVQSTLRVVQDSPDDALM